MPEVLETGRRQFGVAHRVLDVAVAQIGLQRPGIDAVIGELEAACVPQHVRMHRETEDRAATPSLATILRNPAGVNGAPLST